MIHKNEIRLQADRKTLRADSNDICYLDLEIICRDSETTFPVLVNLYVSGDAGIHVMPKDGLGTVTLKKVIGISITQPHEKATIVLQAGIVPQIVAVSAIAAGFRPETSRIRLLRNRVGSKNVV